MCRHFDSVLILERSSFFFCFLQIAIIMNPAFNRYFLLWSPSIQMYFGNQQLAKNEFFNVKETNALSLSWFVMVLIQD